MPTRDDIIVHSAGTPANLESFFQLAAETFALNTLQSAARWQRHVECAPDYVPEQVRCAFVATTLVGGFILYERSMRVGFVTIPIGCFASLVTHPDWRGCGVATALMHDALARAIERRLGLILLDGIAGFYGRFGYVDVLDTTRHIISRTHLMAMSRSQYMVRPATPDDAPALLDLYERHYAGYCGSFVRTIEWQRHDLALRLEENPPCLAYDEHGQARGYLLLPSRAPGNHAIEAAADNWWAALALLQHHAGVAGEVVEIDWPLPPDSPMFYTLADHLNVTSRSFHHPDEGWMARPAHVPTLLDRIGPLLEERRRAAGGDAFRLQIESATSLLVVGEGVASDLPTVVLTPQTLLQLLFGFRPASWIARSPGVHIPPAILPTLDAIFPPGHAWIAGSDAF